MGLIYESLGHFDSSLLVFEKELDIYRQLKNPERIGNALENIGTIHLNRGEFKSAITYLIEAKTIYETSGNTKKLPYIYLKLGQIYSELQDFSIAEEWFQKGIEQSLALNDLQKAGLGLNAMGILYKNQGKYEAALAKFDAALNTIKGLKIRSLTMNIYGNMGNVYTGLENYPEALYYHQKSLDLALQLKIPLAIAKQQVNIGQDYYNLKEFFLARTFYEKALPVFNASKTRSELLQTYKALIEVNNALNDFEKSVKYYQLYATVKDSLNKHELNTALDSLRVKFHTEQTDRENILLKGETEFKSKTITLQRTLMISAFILVVLLICLAVVIIRSRLRTKNANELLKLKNLEISAKAEELQRVNDKLVELSKFKDSMNSFLVHDLKNPLNTIVNFDPKQYSEHQIEVLKHTGKRMLHIVMNLLDISRYENKAMIISVENASVTQLINNAFLDVHYAAEQKSIRLMLDYSTDFVVQVDPEIIERVFVNLFSNAITYSAIGDAIQVSAECINKTQVKMIVQDHGQGIEAEYLPIIFDKFTQAQGKKSRTVGSTGVGLTFCKIAIEAHAGEIGVDSVVGQGASFWFTLPLADSKNDLKINPAGVSDKFIEFSKLQLSEKEQDLLRPHCKLLQKLQIYQISDVKDIIHAIDVQGSITITAWKSELLQALSNCNELKYKELINL